MSKPTDELDYVVLLKYIHYQSLWRVRLVLEEAVELGRREISNNTTALARHGILLKCINYQSQRFHREVVELGCTYQTLQRHEKTDCMQLGKGGTWEYQTIRRHCYVIEY